MPDRRARSRVLRLLTVLAGAAGVGGIAVFASRMRRALSDEDRPASFGELQPDDFAERAEPFATRAGVLTGGPADVPTAPVALAAPAGDTQRAVLAPEVAAQLGTEPTTVVDPEPWAPAPVEADLPPTPERTGGKHAAQRSRRPRAVYAIAALAVVFFLVGLAGLPFQGKLGSVRKDENSAFVPPSADSTKVANASTGFDPLQAIPGFLIFQSTSPLDATDLRAIAATARAAQRITGVAGTRVGTAQVSPRDPGVAALSVPLAGRVGGVSRTGEQLVDTENRIVAAAKANAPPGLAVHSAGAGGLLVAFINSFQGLDGTLLLAAGLVVIVILLLVYRSPVLWFFPLFGSVLALGGAALAIYPLAKHDVLTLNSQTQGILSVLVIGAGTDYALLLVSRYREELHAYDSRVDAMIAAWKGAAPAIGASALTVILGLLCLSFAELNSIAGLGPVCAIGIGCTLLIMLTVLPVLLVLPGRWLFWPRIPRSDHAGELETHVAWSRFAGWVSAHRRRCWSIATLFLLICVIGISGLKASGLSQQDGFTNTPDAITGQRIYNANFDQGAGAPAEILTPASSADAVIAAVKRVPGVVPAQVCVQPDYAKLAALIRRSGDVPGSSRTSACVPRRLQVRPIDGRVLIDAGLTTTFDSPTAYRTVRDIRTALATVPGPRAYVGGQTATNLDTNDAAAHDRDLIIPIILVVILIVLCVLLRALLAPLLLIVTVVLSFTASLGVSSFFFDHVFGFANADPAFPLFTFVFLVALGIDYNIFLMTRVREETLSFGTRRGVERGLAVTGGVITSAGVVLAATFVVLGVLPIVFLAEIGFAVAFGVLLDTIVVRSILVPALSLDIGKRIWWPSRLASAAD